MTNREVINNLKDEQLAYFIVVTSEKIFRCYTSSTGGLVGWMSREAKDVPRIERKEYIKIKSKSVFEEGGNDKNG